METNTVNRRQVLKLITGSMLLVETSGLASYVFAGSKSDSGKTIAKISQHEIETILSISKVMFPYQGLGSTPYQQVLLFSHTRSSPDIIDKMIKVGVNNLDQISFPATWLSLSSSKKIEQLKEIENSPFFQLMLNSSIDTIHSNKELWELIGYQGSSIEYGGYIRRGFNDINWLPAV